MASTESAPTVHRVFGPTMKLWMPLKRRKNLAKSLALRKFGLPAKELALQTKRRHILKTEPRATVVRWRQREGALLAAV